MKLRDLLNCNFGVHCKVRHNGRTYQYCDKDDIANGDALKSYLQLLDKTVVAIYPTVSLVSDYFINNAICAGIEIELKEETE